MSCTFLTTFEFASMCNGFLNDEHPNKEAYWTLKLPISRKAAAFYHILTYTILYARDMCANAHVSKPVYVYVWWRLLKRDADGWFGPSALQPGRHQVEFAAEVWALEPGSALEIYSPPL